jgi:predicted nucleic acid-binding protein
LTLVVDASVALRWYVEGPGSTEATRLLDRKEPLVAPDLVVAEVTNAAWKLARAAAITAEHGRAIASAVTGAFDHLVPAAELCRRAYDLATSLDHPLYDCLYLALAERDDGVLVTADERLLRRIDGGEPRGRVRRLGEA